VSLLRRSLSSLQGGKGSDHRRPDPASSKRNVIFDCLEDRRLLSAPAAAVRQRPPGPIAVVLGDQGQGRSQITPPGDRQNDRGNSAGPSASSDPQVALQGNPGNGQGNQDTAPVVAQGNPGNGQGNQDTAPVVAQGNPGNGQGNQGNGQGNQDNGPAITPQDGQGDVPTTAANNGRPEVSAGLGQPGNLTGSSSVDRGTQGSSPSGNAGGGSPGSGQSPAAVQVQDQSKVVSNPGRSESSQAQGNSGSPGALASPGDPGKAKGSENSQRPPASGGSPSTPLIVLTTGGDGTTEDAREASSSDARVDTGSPSSSLSQSTHYNPQATSSDAERSDHGRGNKQRPSRLAGGAEDAQGAEIRAREIALAIDHLLGQGENSPQEVDRLAESLPFDPAKLDQAIEHYLNQVGDLGGALADLLISKHLLPWLQGAALATTACVVAHHVNRKTKPTTLQGAGGGDTISSWLLELRSEEA
jgi:hypothetical protein